MVLVFNFIWFFVFIYLSLSTEDKYFYFIVNNIYVMLNDFVFVIVRVAVWCKFELIFFMKGFIEAKLQKLTSYDNSVISMMVLKLIKTMNWYQCDKKHNFLFYRIQSIFILFSRFLKDTHWSHCSVTCGEGIRTKQYRCKIFLELSQTLATLHNDSFCLGLKPSPEIERCMMEPCSMAYGYDDSYPR